MIRWLMLALSAWNSFLMFFLAFRWLDLGRTDMAGADFACGALALAMFGCYDHLRRKQRTK